MLERFRVENYKALKDVSLDLTPIHVLIGPNDSGKTSLLQALGAFGRSVDMPLSIAFSGLWEGRQLVWKEAVEPIVSLGGDLTDEAGEFAYELKCRFGVDGRQVLVAEEDVGDARFLVRSLNHGDTFVCRSTRSPQSQEPDAAAVAERIHGGLTGVQSYHFVPRFLGLPAASDSARRFRMDSTGFGLSLCLDDILGFDRGRFDELEERFRQVFPEVQSVKLMRGPAFKAPADDPTDVPKLSNAEGKGLAFQLRGSGKLIPASQMSAGSLFVLAYLTVLHLPEPPRFLLVEEPENGIHPKLLDDIVGIIRECVLDQDTTQVLMTTHSPYMLDSFDPEEVTLCRMGEDGAVRTRRLSESPTVQKRRDVFTLGEIWTSQGDEELATGPTEGAAKG